jgi:hypothetical protein
MYPAPPWDLHCAIGHSTYHLTGKHLAAGSISRHVLTSVLAACCFFDHATRCEGLGATVSQHGLDQLLFSDGFTELFAFHRIG